MKFESAGRGAFALSRGEKFLGGNHQDVVPCSSFIFHLSSWNGAALAMTDEQSTTNNEQ
jgi:hypothetical protein